MNLYSHAGRTKSCQRDSRHLPLCTKREATSRRESLQHSSGEEEAPDPDPDVEARQHFWSIMRNHIFRNHVTNSCTPQEHWCWEFLAWCRITDGKYSSNEFVEHNHRYIASPSWRRLHACSSTSNPKNIRNRSETLTIYLRTRDNSACELHKTSSKTTKL